MNRDKFFIGGEWVDPAGHRHPRGDLAGDRRGHRQRPRGHHRRHRPRRRRRPRGVRPRPVAAHDARPSAPTSWPTHLGRHPGPLRGDRPLISERDGLADLASRSWVRSSPPPMVLDYYAGLAREFAFEERRHGMLGPGARAPEPVGVVGAHRPVERAAVRHHAEAGAGAGVGLAPSCSSRRRRRRSTRTSSPRSLEEAGLPAGVLNIVPAGREVGEHLVTPPRRRQDLASPARPPPAGKIGALCGEQLKRCTLELGGKSAAIILDDADLDATIGPAARTPAHEQRPGLRRPDPHPRRRGRATTRSSTRWPRPSARSKVGDPLDPETAGRPAGRRAPARPGRGLHRQGQGRGRPRSSSAAAGRPASTRAGTSSRRCSPTSTTR